DDAALIVVDPAPVRNAAILFPYLAGFEELRARYLVAIVEIVEHVENRVIGGDVHDRAVREYFAHASDEDFPLDRAVEIVAHEETPAQEKLAHRLDLRVGEVPMAHLDAV